MVTRRFKGQGSGDGGHAAAPATLREARESYSRARSARDRSSRRARRVRRDCRLWRANRRDSDEGFGVGRRGQGHGTGVLPDGLSEMTGGCDNRPTVDEAGHDRVASRRNAVGIGLQEKIARAQREGRIGTGDAARAVNPAAILGTAATSTRTNSSLPDPRHTADTFGHWSAAVSAQPRASARPARRRFRSDRPGGASKAPGTAGGVPRRQSVDRSAESRTERAE